MSNQQLKELLSQALELVSMGSNDGGTEERKYPTLFELQPLGFYKIGEVEEFRDWLKALTGNQIAQSWVKESPEFFMVQDGESFLPMTPAQIELQDFNCGNARFTMGIMGGTQTSSNVEDPMWRSWWYAIQRVFNEETQHSEDTFIKDANGKPVVAVPDNSRAGTRVLKINPGVKDMAGVVERAYKYHYARNHVALGDNNTDPMHG